MLEIHATHPQARLINKAVECLQKGGVIIYPTDSAYALGCALDNHEGIARIRRIRQLNEQHNFTLICRDLSEISSYASFDTVVFRLLKAHTPGPYTFIMLATKEVPKRLQHPRKKTIGLRVPDHPVTAALLERLNQPMLSVSLILPGETDAVANIEDLPSSVKSLVDEVIDSGCCGLELTSVIDLTSDVPKVTRVGKGDVTAF